MALAPRPPSPPAAGPARAECNEQHRKRRQARSTRTRPLTFAYCGVDAVGGLIVEETTRFASGSWSSPGILYASYAFFPQCTFDVPKLPALLAIEGRIVKVEPLHRADDRFGDDEPREPFVIGGHPEPGRIRSGRVADRVFVGGHVVAPAFTLANVGRRKFPVLGRGIEALEKSILLLRPRHVQKELQDHDAVARQVTFEADDVLEALLPDAFGDHLWRQPLPRQDFRVHANDEDLLVVRAVEDADLASRREAHRRPPQVIVAELLGGRRLEGRDV